MARIEFEFDDGKSEHDEDLDQSFSENICTICIEEVKEENLAKVEGCSHVFCDECIQQWAKTENKCPNCKEKFNIIITKTEEIKVPDQSGLKGDYDDSEHYGSEMDHHFCEICYDSITDSENHYHCGVCYAPAHKVCII